MKRKYCKPEIQFESFALSVDIAGGCDRIIDTYRGGQCGLDVVGIIGPVFTPTVPACEFDVEDNGRYFDGICYHVPTPGNNLFNS